MNAIDAAADASCCPRCGTSFGCAMREGNADCRDCWCAKVPARLPVPSDTNAACLCPKCLDVLVSSVDLAQPGK